MTTPGREADAAATALLDRGRQPVVMMDIGPVLDLEGFAYAGVTLDQTDDRAFAEK